MSEAVEELAAALEEHGTSRADFRDVSDSQRYTIARWLVIARSQANASNAPEDKTQGRYGEHLVRKKNRYFHACGRAGIEVKEANAIWWSAVYGGAAPVERRKLV